MIDIDIKCIVHNLEMKCDVFYQMAAPDMSGMAAMADHFVKMQRLPPKEAIKGCPNFRRIPGYKVTFSPSDLVYIFDIGFHNFAIF